MIWLIVIPSVLFLLMLALAGWELWHAPDESELWPDHKPRGPWDQL